MGQNITRVCECGSWICKDCKNSNTNKKNSDSPADAEPRKNLLDNKKSNESRLNDQVKELINSNKLLYKSFEDIKIIINDIKANQEFLSNKFDDFNLKITKLSEEHNEFKKEIISILKNHTEQVNIIHKLEADIDMFNQKELDKNIIIGMVCPKTQM